MSRFRIIFVPGMKPKPPPAEHKRQLLRCLLAGLGRVDANAAAILAREPERFELFSWTYEFHGSHRNIELDKAGVERLLAEPEPSARDIAEIDSLGRRVRRLTHVVGDAFPIFGRWIVHEDLRVALREARRYLRNREGVADVVRRRLEDAIQGGLQAGERILLIAHSLGSVIAYDALWELNHDRRDARTVDVFLTIGSPLRTRFVRTHLRGSQMRGAARYPHGIRHWFNFSAKSEMTALHPKLRPYFEDMVVLGLVERLVDKVDIYNHFRGAYGLNVHKSYGYLVNRAVALCIAGWLTEVASGVGAAVARDMSSPGAP